MPKQSKEIYNTVIDQVETKAEDSFRRESLENFSIYGYAVSEDQSGFKLAVDDMLAGLARARLWLMLAFFDMRARYHRTLLGPVWVLCSFTIFLLVKIFIFSEMAGADSAAYIVHLTMGLCVWLFLTSAVGDGSNAIVRNRSWILGLRAPYSLFVYSSLTVCFFNFLICLVPSYWVSMFYTSIGVEQLLLSLVGVLLVTYCLVWASFCLAIVCVFARDFIPLVNTAMRILFFLTPIIWLPSMVGPEKAVFILWNPLYHMIEVVRAPIMIGEMPVLHLQVVVGLSIGLKALCVILFGFLRRWVPSYL